MSVEIYKKSEKQIILPGLNEEQQLRLESAKRYCQEQSVRFAVFNFLVPFSSSDS